MKAKLLRFIPIVVAALAVAGGSGCGGVSASKSISPLDFILPGLTENPKRPPENAIITNTPASQVVIAQAHAHLAARNVSLP